LAGETEVLEENLSQCHFVASVFMGIFLGRSEQQDVIFIAPSGYATRPRTPVHGEEIKKEGREVPT
jgi:hypothetical protein